MKNINGLALAYIGDAIYEVFVREYLLSCGYVKVNDLHKRAVLFTSGEAQASFIDYFFEKNILTDEEMGYYKKGRNMANSYRKNVPLNVYQKATGFEAVIGYLYVSNNKKRIEELFEFIKSCVKIMKSGDDNGRE